jgi:thioester reductase-like protein/FkbH-like protein
MIQRPISAEDIRAWLIARLAALLNMPEAEVAAVEAIDELGVDSVTIARMTEEVRETVGVNLPPMLFYEVPDMAGLVARIAAAAETHVLRRRLPKIALAATFTAEPLEEPLGYLLDQVGLAAELAFAPYNQIFQQLLDSQAAISREPAVARLVLIRVEDWFRYAKHPLALDRVAEIAGQLEAALVAARARLDGPLLVALCPHAADASTLIDRADQVIVEMLGRLSGVEMVDLRRLDVQYPGSALHDPARDRLGHIPYSPDGYAVLALGLGRRLRRALGRAAKVLAVDCDETLWQGVVGEDGVAGIGFGAGHLALQNFLIERKRAGQLLVLVSKNAEADVLGVFEKRAEMRLGLADVVAHRIDWNAKPDNLRSIASELDLGLDSFVFIDDSPAECAAMRAALPEVTVVQLPKHAADYGRFLDAHWAFDTAEATVEDRRRTEMYQEARARRQLAQDTASVTDFLTALAIEISVKPLVAADVPRAAQLTQRTNQFNTTSIRRDETQLARLLDATPPQALTVLVRDRFGDYGFVGLAVLDWADRVCTIDNLLLSCRVLGRRVEHAVIAHIAALARDQDIGRLHIPFEASTRNQPAQRFLEGLGVLSDHVLDLALADVDAALSRSDAPMMPVGEEGETAEAEPTAVAEMPVAPSEGLSRIAGLAGPAGLVAALAARIRTRLELDRPYLAPRTPLQAEIAQIWCQVLRLDRVGIDDDFFSLGGDSLTGVEMVARLYELGLPEQIGIGIMHQPTVAGLAQAIEDVRQGRAPRLVASLESLETAARLPDDLRRLCAAAARSPVATSSKTYFLTGATGYVGGHLAAELLARPDIKLICHVRAKDEQDGWRRLRGNLERYGLWQMGFADRLSVALGTLDMPRMGLSDALYEQFAQEVDAVIHNGARVNFVMPYSHLAGANVGGTLEALRFAAHGRTKPLHFVSTLGVLMSGYRHDQVIAEDAELDHSEDLPNGYEQTKWVADKMVWHAMQAGYPAAIYRLGMLSGLAGSGTYHKLDEFLPSFLKGCIQLGSFPHLNSKIEMVPVDVVTCALATILMQPGAIGRVFHMNHPDAITDERFVDRIRDFGYPLRFLPWDIWKKELFGAGDRLRANALYPFLDFIRGLQAHQTRIPEMDMTNFFDLAAGEVASCPTQTLLLRRYFDHFVGVGYLPAPEAACLVDVAE